MAYLDPLAVACLWGDNGTREIFDSIIGDMNCWLNRGLKLINKAIDLCSAISTLAAAGTSRSWKTAQYVYSIGAMRAFSRHSSTLLLPHA